MLTDWLFEMKNIVSTFIILAIFASCSTEPEKEFDFAGGTISVAIDNEPATFDPREVNDYYSNYVLTQVLEGLVSLDPKELTVQPQLASDWEISDDGLSYTFTLRENVLFHPHPVFNSDKERKLTSKDVVKSVERACSKNDKGEATHAYNYLYKDNLVGANDYFDGKTKEITGLKTQGKKVTFQLIHKDDNFLNKLSNISAAISSEKIIAAKKDKDLIGTGPFIYKEYKKGTPNSMVFLRNPEYYLKDKKGNTLPYLDSLIIYFQTRKLDQMEMFENGQIDLITGLPTSRITKMLEGRIKDFNSSPPKLILYNNPLLTTHYYFFNMNDPRFSKLKVRQAFNYAIDKEKLGRDILRNQYHEIGTYGIVPPIPKIFKGYDFNGVKEASYSYNPEKARKLLAEAGYPDGKGFGSVNLRFNIDDLNSAVADEFAQQIFQVLNINVNIDGSSFELKVDDASYGKGDIFRSAWSGDYASPETFLSNFYGKYVPASMDEPSRINQPRYVNPLFDQLYEQAINSDKKTDAIQYFSKAEKVLMQNPPIIPLWYSGDFQITYSNVRNLQFNALNLFSFKEVYIKEWTAEEYQKTKKN